jgi:hypothetical protein
VGGLASESRTQSLLPSGMKVLILRFHGRGMDIAVKHEMSDWEFYLMRTVVRGRICEC